VFATLEKAQRMIAGCEACSEDAELPFENILDRLTGRIDWFCLPCREYSMRRQGRRWTSDILRTGDAFSQRSFDCPIIVTQIRIS
jgi:hypothetical protein